MNIPIKMLALGPSIRSIISLQSSSDGKTSMSGMILAFPGAQPTGDETKTSVCASTSTSVTVRACALLIAVRGHHLLSLWMVLCMLTVFPVRVPDGILPDVRNAPLLSPSLSTTTRHPAAWTRPDPRARPPGRRKGGEQLLQAQPPPSAFMLFSPFLLLPIPSMTVLFVQAAFGSSLEPKIHKPASSEASTLHILSSPVLCPVQWVSKPVKSAAPGIASMATPSPRTAVPSYRLHLST